MPPYRFIILCTCFCLYSLFASAQAWPTDSMGETPATVKFLSLEQATHFDKKRFWVSAGAGFGFYAAASYAMWDAWYKDYPLTGFHTFNDLKEWKGMDKAGHFHAAYVQSKYAFKGALWTGMDRRKAMWTGVGVATGIQATIEIMDGFSEEWGFSVGDIAFNTLGASLFAAQEMLWQEQRILMKVSSTQPDYPRSPVFSIDGGHQTTLRQRADELYGSSPSEVFLKDYNAMTIWASFNIKAFTSKKNGKFPAWLNAAFGLGASNIYGGFSNQWSNDDGGQFALSEQEYPRYYQFYLAPDIDLSRIPSRHKWVKFALGFVNWIKIPSPAMELNSRSGLKFHAFYW
ncbi:MAG: DUF2279 domain-containing protein [Saprospiraceae bacterium]